MQASVVISYYKNVEALALLLKALNQQSTLPQEVIIAEDDNDETTSQFLSSNVKAHNFKLVHLYQDENIGFRKNQMLNRAVASSKNELIAFLDGDCIPHKHWLAMCIKHTEPKKPVFGRRVMLGPKFTDKVYKQSIDQFSFINLLFSDSKRVKYGLFLPFFGIQKRSGMWGCNWAIYKSDLLAIDGFDEQYTRAGIGEDVDVEWRLNEAGIFFSSVRHHALVYHLHHESNYSDDDVNFNKAILAKKKTAKENNVSK